jgi:hypothetical protein
VKSIRLAVLLTSGLLAAALPVRAEEKKMEAPRPAPEVKKLGYFFGTWNSEAEVKPNSFMPAGHYTWTEKCDWYPGGFHLLCFTAGKGPAGGTRGMAILFYNREEKAYTYWGIDDSGHSNASRGTVDGNNWTYTSDEKMAGKTFHGRYSLTASETSYTFKYETSEDGKNWTLVMEGKTKRPEKKVRREREYGRKK